MNDVPTDSDGGDPQAAAGEAPRFKAGEAVMLVDRKGREHFAVLETGGLEKTRGNQISHDTIIGQPDGAKIVAHTGRRFHLFRPTLRQFVLYMPRHAQIVYPKDLAMLVWWADVQPGDVVVEAGFGSGALTLALLRAVGPTGRVITYEVREEPSRRAQKNLELALGGPPPNHTLKIGDIYEGIDERGVDRVILDLPEPWEVARHAAEALRPGGTIGIYVPTALQLQRAALTLERTDQAFGDIQGMETIRRPWHLTARSVRPEQRIIGHTGFLLFARRQLTEESGSDQLPW